MASRGTYSDYFDALAMRESSDNYAAVSSLGYLGRYQLSEPALQEIGYYAGDSTAAQDFVGRWTGRGGINSKADFLGSPAVQDAAAREYTAWNWDTLSQYGYNVYAGQTLNGHRMTLSGILGATWLVGFAGMRAFLDSGGTSARADGYGTSMLEYLSLFNDFQTPSAFASGLNGHNYIEGGAGNDGLRGLGGDDTLAGAGGRDTAYFRGEASAYTLTREGGSVRVAHEGGSGRDGTDILTGIEVAAFADRLVDLSDFDPVGDPAGRDGARIVGTADADRLTGTRGDDVMRGLSGRDVLRGRGGDDRIDTGAAADVAAGGGGADTLRGSFGNDRLYGGPGDDALRGEPGRDVLSGGPGADWLSGGSANDRLAGGAGGDRLFGNAGHDRLSGGGGDDVLSGGPGRDRLAGGAGNDVFTFAPGTGRDVIADFAAGDRIDLSAFPGIAGLADVRIDPRGSGVTLFAGNAVIVLPGANPGDLDGAFLF
ncbi:calcium-binding protein [Acuticoccus sp. MNP-M23]|uniref:calcium-binding protein n=1 Tax=Acuticoccus sp. MNP-M23 TaxID=3072793 RepID=UPI0028166A53|nr:calcium-binding protein [Acuticoccus sp. MNP-M23]WMS42857.1 calcium-binding protein [Acuticoccus sp. MNP-M23]